MTGQQIMDLTAQYLGDTVGSSNFYTSAKVIAANNAVYRGLRHKILEADPRGEHLAAEADASYPALTRWYTFSGVGRWTAAGRPLKIFDVRRISAVNANELGEQIAIVDSRAEEAYANAYTSTYMMLDGDNIGLRSGGAAPDSATVLRIRFSPPAVAITLATLANEPVFIPDFYELIALKSAVHLAVSEDKPLSDLATLSDEMERGLMSYLAQGRSTNTRNQIQVTDEMADLYDYGR